mmetsp:Transcript_23449/g.34583  ORF Transcript_23449/g.34583 Transcript_23449/m.34583 type:complete len:102 (-) Transcript_23449:101-406(-)
MTKKKGSLRKKKIDAAASAIRMSEDTSSQEIPIQNTKWLSLPLCLNEISFPLQVRYLYIRMVRTRRHDPEKAKTHEPEADSVSASNMEAVTISHSKKEKKQ